MPMSAMRRVAATERRTEAVRLAASGMGYSQIAERLGFHDRSGAYKAVQASLAAHQVQAVDELRTLEVDRLDALQQALWADAHAGNLKAVDAVLRIVQARVRLLGLDQQGNVPAIGGGRLVSSSWQPGRTGMESATEAG